MAHYGVECHNMNQHEESQKTKWTVKVKSWQDLAETERNEPKQF